MSLQTKITAFFAVLSACLIVVLVAIGLHYFRQYSIVAPAEQTLTMAIGHLKVMLILMVAAVAFFTLVNFLLLRRLIHPIVDTAGNVGAAVQRAIGGDFRTVVEVSTRDEIGRIAGDMNRLLGYLDDGLNRIGREVAQLTNHAPSCKGNLLDATVEMVETLTDVAHFKQTIEEDETKAEIYARLSVAVEKHFDVHEYSIYEVLPGRNQMLPMFVDGEVQGACRWCDPQILVRSEACRARRTGHTVNSIDAPGICYSFQPPPEAGSRRHICFPVIQSGTVGSVLQLVVADADRQRAQDLVPYISVYLREAAPVLEAKRLTETLRESNLRDPMTGLHNRRFLEESVETLVAQARRRNAHMAILMLDLDYFKMVNDTYGHDAGDAVLKSLAKVLTQAVRASDYVIRYGGEEFLMLMQDVDGDQATVVAEKIRAAVEEMKVQVAGKVLQKTISIGIADFPGDSDTFWQTVKFADVALYHAKETGRNRVIRFKPELWSDKKEY
ncbi:MAG: diguanylate cyclase [Rhodocyclaceae bacterium]|nr:diguanylate cyclase [Rhodocyclaceae bacterium]